MRAKQNWFHLIKPSELVRLIHYHENDMGETAPMIQLFPTGSPHNMWELWEYNLRWDLGGGQRAKPYQKPSPGFQKMYGKACMSSRSLLGWRPHGKCLLQQCRGRIWGRSPHRVPTGALPSGALRRRPPSSRPQNDRSTDSLHPEPGKAARTQC